MTDPVTIAREVLARDAEADSLDDRVGYDSTDSLYIENGWSAPALARAVLRMDELADRLDDGHLRYLIRSELNGDAA